MRDFQEYRAEIEATGRCFEAWATFDGVGGDNDVVTKLMRQAADLGFVTCADFGVAPQAIVACRDGDRLVAVVEFEKPGRESIYWEGREWRD